jgi:DNA helicase HerA-like ATPase
VAIAQLRPNERYALVGKTRSGKTALAMVLAGTFARSLPYPWEVWWVDTKNDEKDIKELRRWGFRNAASVEDQSTSRITNAKYFYVVTNDERFDPATVEQVQEICRAAYSRKNVIVCIDEYVQAVPSQRNAGAALLNIFQRGGGRNVGLIGLTQEPKFVPRQLISQATHTVMLNLTYGYDVEYLQAIDKAYVPPKKLGDQYGFWWRWNDGGGDMDYFPNQRVWYDQLKVAMNRAEQEANNSAMSLAKDV